MKSFINFLPPWVETNIQPAFYDKESGTVLQQTARMYAKVNQLIRHFNDLSKETKETVAEFIAKFVELKDFVDNYFENLDVQEEINNKLDEMVEDGTLEEIIGDYIENTYIYTEIEVNEYTYTNGTKYWITHVPHLDSNGNLIKLQHGLALDNESATLSSDETPRHFAARKGATICVNASIGGTIPEEASYQKPIGPIIKDGILICNNTTAGYSTNPIHVLGVKEDNTLAVYPRDVSPSTLIEDGVVNSFTAFDRVIDGNDITTAFHDTLYQWNLIGQDTNTKDIYLFECNGKDVFDQKGITLPEACRLFKEATGVSFAFRLDQGGSTSLSQNGVQLNYPTDEYGKSERKVPDYIYFGKTPTTNRDLVVAENYKLLSETSIENMTERAKRKYLADVRNNHIAFYVPNIAHPLEEDGLTFNLKTYDSESETYVNDTSLLINPSSYPKSMSLYDNENDRAVWGINGITGFMSIADGDLAKIFRNAHKVSDLNNLKETGIYYADGTTLNRPQDLQYFVMVVQTSNNNALQIAVPIRGNMSLSPICMRIIQSTSQTGGGTWYKCPLLEAL